MANFTQKRKFKTSKPTLKVDAGLPVGVYTFRLVVTNDGGIRSKAAQVKVKIINPTNPPVLGGGGSIVPGVSPNRPTTPITPVIPGRPGNN